MVEMNGYSMLRTVADVTGKYGRVIVGFVFALGLVCGLRAGGLVPGLFWGFVFGIFVGVPLVVLGQWVAISLDQKELLEKILLALKEGGKRPEKIL